MDDSVLEVHAREYAKSRDATIERQLGRGQDGAVWFAEYANYGTAAKAFERETNYQTEIRCYQRLADNSISKLRGFAIPKLLDSSNDLMVIEMEFVFPPYLLDFGKAHLDRKPDFSDEVWEEWNESGREFFGSRWKEVGALLRALEQHGIYYLDAKPGNIRFGDEADD